MIENTHNSGTITLSLLKKKQVLAKELELFILFRFYKCHYIEHSIDPRYVKYTTNNVSFSKLKENNMRND